MSTEDVVIEGKGGNQAVKTASPRATKKDETPRVMIMIPKTKDDVRDVFVSVNFKPYLIKRGVKTEVPEEVAHALEIAVGTTMIPEEDPVTKRITLVPQETQSVPFQYVR